jgi:hypothetical protein
MPQFKRRRFRRSDASENTQSSDGGSRRSDDISRNSATPRESGEMPERKRWRMFARNSGRTTQSAEPEGITDHRTSAATWRSDEVMYGRIGWE